MDESSLLPSSSHKDSIEIFPEGTMIANTPSAAAPYIKDMQSKLKHNEESAGDLPLPNATANDTSITSLTHLEEGENTIKCDQTNLHVSLFPSTTDIPGEEDVSSIEEEKSVLDAVQLVSSSNSDANLIPNTSDYLQEQDNTSRIDCLSLQPTEEEKFLSTYNYSASIISYDMFLNKNEKDNAENFIDDVAGENFEHYESNKNQVDLIIAEERPFNLLLLANTALKRQEENFRNIFSQQPKNCHKNAINVLIKAAFNIESEFEKYMTKKAVSVGINDGLELDDFSDNEADEDYFYPMTDEEDDTFDNMRTLAVDDYSEYEISQSDEEIDDDYPDDEETSTYANRTRLRSSSTSAGEEQQTKKIQLDASMRNIQMSVSGSDIKMSQSSRDQR